MTLKMLKKLIGAAPMVGLMLVFAAFGATQAMAKKMDERAVKQIMSDAFQQLPERYKLPSGKIIEIDRKKPNAVLIPVDDARRVLRTATLSGFAQICKRPDLQLANHRAFMKLEEINHKWSDQQMLFINQLHIYWVMHTAGQETKDEKEFKKMSEAAYKKLCTDKVQKQLVTKIKNLVTEARSKNKK